MRPPTLRPTTFWPPAFWYDRQATTWPTMMSPLAALYGWGGRTRAAMAKPWRAPCPVVCVGNLVAGGAGKTPTAIAIAAKLSRMGMRPAFLSRGYRGKEVGPVRVDQMRHTAQDVGDEPLLLAGLAPTWVARNRPDGARAAVAAGHDVIVMDDGFQNPSLHKDLSVIVIDGELGFGNGHIMPAGPLRESVAGGVARAQAALIIGEDVHGVSQSLAPATQVLGARIVPTPGAREFAGRRVVAFAGIGRPGKLFESLEQIGCDVVEHYAFPDHHMYTPEQIMALCEQATKKKALPITTEKDFARLPEAARLMVKTFPIALEWTEPDKIAELLATIVEPNGTPRLH